ncbi:MAG: ABC transporter ATP-binding protein [Nanoarchaeota archaeon]
MLERNPVLRIIDLKKSFGHKKVLNDMSLEIYENEILLIMGRSGCGKSTLFKILLGFMKPDSGHLWYKNFDLSTKSKIFKREVGFVSQENSFYEKLTVNENLKFYASLYKVSSKDINRRINMLLDFVKLSGNENVLAGKLSGGMKRRLEFAISLVHNPRILILDEPFTGLDLQLKKDLWTLVNKVKASGVTIIIASHLIKESQEYIDRAVYVSEGRVKKIFETSEINNGHDDLEKEFLLEVRG